MKLIKKSELAQLTGTWGVCHALIYLALKEDTEIPPSIGLNQLWEFSILTNKRLPEYPECLFTTSEINENNWEFIRNYISHWKLRLSVETEKEVLKNKTYRKDYIEALKLIKS